MTHYNRTAIKFYCGVDLHKRKSYVYVIDHLGVKVEGREIITSQACFEQIFSSYSSEELLVAVEISSLTFWFCDVLQKLPLSVYVVNTLENHYISHSLTKTDKQDARKLAIQLWKDILPSPVYIPKKAERDLRHLVSQRYWLVKNLTGVINRTSYLLANYDLKFSRRSLTSPKRWQYLRETFESGENFKGKDTDIKSSRIAVDDVLISEFTIQYEQFQMIKKQISLVEKYLLIHLEKSPRLNRMYQLLLSIPGLGPITSSALIGSVGDIERFKSGRQLVSYLGLCPKVRESGGKSLGNGSITKRGNSRLRGYFVQAAVALLNCRRSDAIPLKEWYERIRKKKGWRKARVALARKLALVAFGVLKTNSPYDPLKVESKKNELVKQPAKKRDL